MGHVTLRDTMTLAEETFSLDLVKSFSAAFSEISFPPHVGVKFSSPDLNDTDPWSRCVMEEVCVTEKQMVRFTITHAVF